MEASSSPSGQGGDLPFKDRMFAHYSCISPRTNYVSKYELERQKYAQDLIDFDREFSALFSGKPRTSDNEKGVTHEQFLRSSCLDGDVQ